MKSQSNQKSAQRAFILYPSIFIMICLTLRGQFYLLPS